MCFRSKWIAGWLYRLQPDGVLRNQPVASLSPAYNMLMGGVDRTLGKRMDLTGNLSVFGSVSFSLTMLSVMLTYFTRKDHNVGPRIHFHFALS